MKKLALAAILATAATASHADIGAVFLPTLTFPDSTPAPTVSTQGCAPTAGCTN